MRIITKRSAVVVWLTQVVVFGFGCSLGQGNVAAAAFHSPFVRGRVQRRSSNCPKQNILCTTLPFKRGSVASNAVGGSLFLFFGDSRSSAYQRRSDNIKRKKRKKAKHVRPADSKTSSLFDKFKGGIYFLSDRLSVLRKNGLSSSAATASSSSGHSGKLYDGYADRARDLSKRKTTDRRDWMVPLANTERPKNDELDPPKETTNIFDASKETIYNVLDNVQLARTDIGGPIGTTRRRPSSVVEAGTNVKPVARRDVPAAQLVAINNSRYTSFDADRMPPLDAFKEFVYSTTDVVESTVTQTIQTAQSVPPQIRHTVRTVQAIPVAVQTTIRATQETLTVTGPRRLQDTVQQVQRRTRATENALRRTVAAVQAAPGAVQTAVEQQQAQLRRVIEAWREMVTTVAVTLRLQKRAPRPPATPPPPVLPTWGEIGTGLTTALAWETLQGMAWLGKETGQFLWNQIIVKLFITAVDEIRKSQQQLGMQQPQQRQNTSEATSQPATNRRASILSWKPIQKTQSSNQPLSGPAVLPQRQQQAVSLDDKQLKLKISGAVELAEDALLAGKSVVAENIGTTNVAMATDVSSETAAEMAESTRNSIIGLQRAESEEGVEAMVAANDGFTGRAESEATLEAIAGADDDFTEKSTQMMPGLVKEFAAEQSESLSDRVANNEARNASISTENAINSRTSSASKTFYRKTPLLWNTFTVVAILYSTIARLSFTVLRFLPFFNRIAPEIRKPSTAMVPAGKVAVITGCSTGIGFETAAELISRGYQVVVGVRSEEKGRDTVARLNNQTGTAASAVFVAPLDLADRQSVNDFCFAVAGKYNKIDVLINNAGRNTNGDPVGGVDLSFLTNFLGHFQLTNKLMPLLLAAGTPRVVNLCSVMHHFCAAEQHDESYWRRFALFDTKRVETSYSPSKLAMVYFTLGLNERFASKGLKSFAVNPGAVNSDIWRSKPKWLKALFRLFYLTNRQGCQTSVAACVEDLPADVIYLQPYWQRNSRQAPWPPTEMLGPFVGFQATPPRLPVGGGVHSAESLWKCSEDLITRKDSFEGKAKSPIFEAAPR